MEWWMIVSAVIGIGGAIFGTTCWKKIHEVSNAFIEFGEVFQAMGEAIQPEEDGTVRITKAEALKCLKEGYDAFNAVLILLPPALVAKLTRRLSP